MNHTMMEFPLTVAAIFNHAERNHATTEIVARLPHKKMHRYTVKDFCFRVRRLIQALGKIGLKKGDVVCTLMVNHHVHLEAYFAIPIAGLVINTLNLRQSPENIAHIIKDTEAKMLVLDEELLPIYEKFKHMVSLESIVLVSESKIEFKSCFLDYEEFIAGCRPINAEFMQDENSPASVCYTSGTTGAPKGVVYSHRALVLQSLCVALPDIFNLSMRQVVCLVVPMFHVNGWCLPFASLLTGAKLVLPGLDLGGASLFSLFKNERVTFSAGVPSLWHGFIEYLKLNHSRNELDPDIHLVVAGSACSPEMFKSFDALGIKVSHAWGMTEMSPVGTFSTLKPEIKNLPSDKINEIRMKQGLSLPFVNSRISTEAGTAGWDGKTVGELQVMGPCVARSYYNNFDNASWTEDGWLKTGDMAHIDEYGYIQIVDRKKDLIKSGGEWISSIELEGVLMSHPSVLEAAVIAVPHDKWQERPLACVVLNPAAKEALSSDLLRTYLKGLIPGWWMPDEIVFVVSLPKTPTGKYNKVALREMYGKNS